MRSHLHTVRNSSVQLSAVRDSSGEFWAVMHSYAQFVTQFVTVCNIFDEKFVTVLYSSLQLCTVRNTVRNSSQWFVAQKKKNNNLIGFALRIQKPIKKMIFFFFF